MNREETLSKLAVFRKILTAFLLCACSVSLFLPPCFSRPFTVQDSIGLTRFGGNGTASFSPTGRYFVFYGSRGNLQTNQTESRIWLFETAKVQSFLSNKEIAAEPKTLFLKAETVNDSEVIPDVRWFDDASLLFLARDGNSAKGLYQVNVDGKVTQLSLPEQDVTSFVIGKNVVVYTCQKLPQLDDLYRSTGKGLADTVVGNNHSLFELVYPNVNKASLEASLPQEIWRVENGVCEQIKDGGLAVSFTTGQTGLFLSPDASRLAYIAHAETVPDSWQRYRPRRDNNPVIKFVPDSKASGLSNGLWNRPEQYFLLDLKSGKRGPLVDAPLGTTADYRDLTEVVWSPDGSNAVLSNIFFPDKVTGTTTVSRRPGVLLIDFASDNLQALAQVPEEIGNSESLWQISWKDAVGPALHYKERCDLYQRRDGAWVVTKQVPSEAPREDSNRTEVVSGIDQNLNEAPHLKAALKGKMEAPKVIFNPNQYLSHVELGKCEEYKWSDTGGSSWTGLLIKPPDFKIGRRYPLLLQTHGCSLHRFFSDGYFSTANPGRALAARGFLILQVSDPGSHKGTPMEAELARLGYVAAVRQLIGEGIVDPARVGIVGFSITGWFMLNTLIRDPSVFAAASFADGSDAGLAGYYASIGSMNSERPKRYVQQFVGVEPFGDGLKQWLAMSPALNTDRIKAPLLCELHSPLAMLVAWDLYAALRAQKKPVDLLYLRDAAHELCKPKERFASQEINADWFDFWLNGHEDAAPAKQQQYARWRELRKQN